VDDACRVARERIDVSRFAHLARSLMASPLLSSLRFRLTLLVLLASLPSLGLLLLTASQERDAAEEAGQAEAGRLAQLVANDQRDLSRNIELGLTALSSLPELRGTDPSACTEFLQNLPTSGGEPGPSGTANEYQIVNASYRSVAVVNQNDSIFCRGGPSVTAIAPADVAILHGALTDRRLTFGNYRADPATGALLVTYSYPVERDEGQGERAILATLEITALSDFAREALLPPGAVITIFDNEGIVRQRYPPNEIPIGASIQGTPEVDDAIGTAPRREAEPGDRDLDESYLFDVQELFLSGAIDGSARAYVMVALPRDEIVRRATEKFYENLGKLGIVALVAMVAAWIGADLFVSRDAEARKSVIRSLYNAFSTGDTSELDDIIGPGYIDRTLAPGQAPGLDGLIQSIGAFRAAFPDGEITIRELLADDDKVVARVTLTGTHVADYFGTPPSGRPIATEGVETFRFAHGMVVESWSLFGEIRPLRAADPAPAAEEEESPGLLSRIFGRQREPEEGDLDRV
jgi:predicted ester cyclase